MIERIGPAFPESITEESADRFIAFFREVEDAVQLDALTIFVVSPESGGFKNTLRLERIGDSIERRPTIDPDPATMELLRGIVMEQPRLVAQAESGQVTNSSAMPSAMYVAIGEGAPLGVLCAQSRRVDAYTEDDLKRLARFTGEAAPMLRHLSLVTQLTNRVEELRAVNAILAEINREAPLGRVLRRVLDHAARFLRAPYAVCLLREGDRLVPQESIGFPAEYLNRVGTVSLSEDPHIGETSVRREAIAEGTGIISSEAKALGVQSILSVPIRKDDQLLGTLQFASIYRTAFDRENRNFAEIAAAQLAGVVQTSELRLQISASEMRLRALIDNTEDAIILSNAEGRVTDWNEAATRLFSGAVAELRATNLPALFGGQWRRRISRQVLEAPLSSPLIIPHAEFNRLDNSVVFFARATVLPLYSGEEVAPTGFGLIVRATEKPADFSEFLSGQGEVLTSSAHQILRAIAPVLYSAMPGNPPELLGIHGNCDELFGCDGKALLKDPEIWREAVIAEDRPVLESRGRLGKKGGPRVLEYRLRSAKGDIRLIREFIIPVYGPSGEIQRFEGALLEVDLQGPTASRLIQEERDRYLAIMTGGLTHELNSIGIGILSAGSFARSQIEPRHPVAKFLRLIEQGGERMRELTDKLLFYSGRKAPRLGKIDVNALIRSAAARLTSVVVPGALVAYELTPDLAPAHADSEMLMSALGYLLENGYESQNRRGSLTIFTGLIQSFERLPGVPGAVKPGSYVCVGVADKGPGFDESEFESMLQPFVSTRRAGGGLGLAAAASIVRAMGGYIGGKSRRDSGSRFFMFLPVYAERDSERPEAEGKESTTGEPEVQKSVLLIESDAMQRNFQSLLLHEAGYRVASARSFAEGLTLLRQQVGTVDLVVIELPERPDAAQERLDALRAVHPLSRILGTTATLSPDIEEYAQGEDIACSLLKQPFTPREFLAGVKRALIEE